MVEAITCAKCCSIFSVTGILFLLSVGILLDKQPLYIKGPEDSDAAASGCYQGAILYLVTFFISIGYWLWYDQKNGTGFFLKESVVRKSRNIINGSNSKSEYREYGSLSNT